MPAGHTDRATINARRPLTDAMRDVLGALLVGPVAHDDLRQAGKNAMRALCDRGYASWEINGRAYVVTDAGREVAKTN